MLYYDGPNEIGYINQINGTPLNLQIGNSTKLEINKFGTVTTGIATATSFDSTSSSTFNDRVYWKSSGTTKMSTLASNAGMNWQDSVKAEFGNSGDLKIYHESGVNYIYGATASPIAFMVNADEKLRITTDGEVGIGTDNPQHQFDLYDIQASSSGTAPVLNIRNGYAGIPDQSNALKSEIRFSHRNHNSAHDFMATRIISETTDNYMQRTFLRFLVANANNDLILKTIMDAESQKLINPVLIGNIEFMTAFIDKHEWSLSKDKLIESYSEEESSKIACEVASRDTGLEKNIIIKGHLHTDVLMGEYIKKEYNLRIRGKRLSHIWFMTFPNDSRNPIIITDGALNISPSLETKKHILSNVLDYIKKISSFNPYVAVLSATEEKLKQMPSSIEAHDLVEWAKINYSDTPVEGPFALDNAISQESAKIKGTLGKVPGNANVIIVPNIETGNALVKSLVHFANATAGGFVIGGKSPVVITSRSDDEKSRMASIINAVICTY